LNYPIDGALRPIDGQDVTGGANSSCHFFRCCTWPTPDLDDSHPFLQR
jgi:hypothetical protein